MRFSFYPVFPALSLRDAGGFAGHGAAPFVERTDGVFPLVGGGDHHMAVVAVAKCLSPHDSLSAALPCALLFSFLSGAGLAHIHSPARGMGGAVVGQLGVGHCLHPRLCAGFVDSVALSRP